MAFAHSEKHAAYLGEDIILNAIMVKNIPLDWKSSHLLHLMSRMRLPLPTALNYLYDNFHNFRGMAFATFPSSDEARRVIQELRYHPVSGRYLNVQYKRKRRESIAGQSLSSRTPLQPNQYSHPFQDKSTVPPPATVCSARRPVRQQTPPSESYDLLMHHQANPIEKEKLRRFLAQTGSHQEAINEFAKNRVRETEERAHGKSLDIRPVLERRPATPGELQQIAKMKSHLRLAGETSSSGSLIIKRQGEEDIADVTEKGILESISLASLEKKHATVAQQGVTPHKRTHKEDAEKRRVESGDDEQEGKDATVEEKR